MTQNVVATMDLSGADKMMTGLRNSGYVARVGIIGSGDSRPDGVMGNAEIGLIQEFGSVTNNIPPRSFLRVPITQNKGKFFKWLSSKPARTMFEAGQYQKIYQTLGVIGRVIVQEAFETRGFGKWQANALSTIAAKGSDAPLIDIGELRKSINSDAAKVVK